MHFLLPFAILGAMGLAGIASLVPTLGPTLEQLRTLPSPPARSDVGLVALILLQPTILLLVAVATGVLLADRVGFRSYLLTWSRGGILFSSFGVGVLPTVSLAATVGAALIALDLLFKEIVAPGSLLRLAETSAAPDWTARISAVLYGGITEELMMRFGLMTLLIWLMSLVVPPTVGSDHPGLIWGGIAVSALLFGLGHLPKLFAITQPSPVLILHVIMLNTLAGLAYGWLYWRHSLEHAIAAHALTHVTFWIVTPIFLRLGSLLLR